MGKLSDAAIRAWMKDREHFEGRSDGDGLYLRFRSVDTVPRWLFRYQLAGMEYRFGRSLAVQQDTLFVGAPGYLAERGVVYVYERTPSWAWPTYPDGSVFAYDGTSFDAFGTSMAVVGDWLAFGAPKMERDQGVAESEGAVYVYRRTDGVFVQAERVMAPSPQSQSAFGQAVAMSGGVLVVDAPDEDDLAGGMDAGAVHVFALDAGRWVHQRRLVNSEAAPADRFGTSVAVRNGTVVAVAGEPTTSTAPTPGLPLPSNLLAVSGPRPAESYRPNLPLPSGRGPLRFRPG